MPWVAAFALVTVAIAAQPPRPPLRDGAWRADSDIDSYCHLRLVPGYRRDWSTQPSGPKFENTSDCGDISHCKADYTEHMCAFWTLGGPTYDRWLRDHPEHCDGPGCRPDKAGPYDPVCTADPAIARNDPARWTCRRP
jgi:hypothetical protein